MIYLVKKYLKAYLTPLLTLGAIVTLGLLSFGGMYVLIPSIGISITALVLSVLYEGEIYQKNISNALKKLFHPNVSAQIIGKEFLRDAKRSRQKPLFFAFLNSYRQLQHQKPSALRDKRLDRMETWLGNLLVTHDAQTDYDKDFLQELPTDSFKDKKKSIDNYHLAIKLFALVSSALMSLGTIYLIIDVLATIPFIMLAPQLLPFVVIPMAIVAGIAYGFLSYNSLTDLLLKNNLHRWWQNINAAEEQISWKYVAIGITFLALNIALTICTAGTWWTLVNSSSITWQWLKNPLGKAASAMIAPVVSASTLAFNLENTFETLQDLNRANQHKKSPAPANTENTWQLFNPFRIILKLTFTPLLMILFLGHLIGIGLTADRMPGIPAIISALLGMISEGFEDFHYFFNAEQIITPLAIFLKILVSPFTAIGYLIKERGNANLKDLSAIFTEGFKEAFAPMEKDECCTHEHSALPNQILELVFSPLFALAALWHWACQSDSQQSFLQCYYLQLGWDWPEQQTPYAEENVGWLQNEAYYTINERINDLSGQFYTANKIQSLNAIKSQLKGDKIDITEALSNDSLNEHRFFAFSRKTTTQECVDELLSLAPICLVIPSNQTNVHGR